MRGREGRKRPMKDGKKRGRVEERKGRERRINDGVTHSLSSLLSPL